MVRSHRGHAQRDGLGSYESRPGLESVSQYTQVQDQLRSSPRRWLVTGAAGFVGSNLFQALLKLDQVVVGLDNFSTGNTRNLCEVQSCVSPAQWKRFRLLEAEIEDPKACAPAMGGIDYVLHQAGLGSVPRS